MSLSGLERAVLLSISYSSIFSFPLTSQEIWLRLIYKKPISYQKVKETLTSLVSKNKILTDGQFYTIQDTSLFDVRETRQKYSVTKRVEANDFIDWGTKEEWFSSTTMKNTYLLDIDGIVLFNTGKYGSKNWFNTLKPIFSGG